MNITQIRNGIMHGNLSDQDLTAVIDAVKYARRNIQRKITSSLMVGDNVEFTSSKTGRQMRGHVTKIAIKYVTVNTGLGMWRVPANMLSKVEEPEAA
jgi:dsDNA-specific endonuclease/ATPase MutS2